MAGATPAIPAAPAAGAPPLAKICFNSHCKLPLPAQPPPQKKGWRLRSGELADLCDRCSCAYEQGSFCETFHSEIAGWRNCETCGKRIHCGCIASATTYALLDAGGIDCIACARKSLTMVPNQILASPMHVHQHAPDRRDFASKSWRPLNGPFPGQWRQTPHMWNMTSAQSDLQQRLSYEFDRPNNIEKMIPGGRHSVSSHERKFEELPERITSSSLGTLPRDKYINGNTGGRDPISIRRPVIPDPCSTTGANPTLTVNPQLAITTKEETPSTLTGSVAPFALTNGSRDVRFLSNPPPSQASPSARQFYNQGAVDAESHAQMLNGRPRFDGRARVPMLPRYWPRTTDQELQQISGDTNSVITPLFEKMLSASDAGRIGRLVLPKKCAEAYFPTISQPEGLPLKVQDASGKEWIFQFRFWPNNNSRMYVLEGVTPCIQAMQLQAGDTVTFSRIDPEGKLIMGFRKASSTPLEQESQTNKSSNGISASAQVDNKSPAVDVVANIPLQEAKLNAEPESTTTMPEQASLSKVPRPEFIQKDEAGVQSSHVSFRRRNGNSVSKVKRLKIENIDATVLKVTWEEAQELLRPPPNVTPTVVKIEGFELEEYEQAPVMGRRTYFTTNQAGENSRWVQCEDCLKWRKLPIDVLLPAKWTCSDNVLDQDRNTCSSAEELSFEKLMDLIYPKAGASKRSKFKLKRENAELSDGLGTLANAILGASKRSRVKMQRENLELSDGLDTLANLAILGEGGNLLTTSQQTTRHPRHRPGCTCIVCIQPPSGKGPKHKHNCACNLCLTVKRRFRTLMLRREKRQSEKEVDKAENGEKVESSRQQQPISTASDQLVQPNPDASSSTPVVNSAPNTPTSSTVAHEGTDHRRMSPSPLKTQIDLNIQPEREEETSPKADTGSMESLNQNAAT